ncbi:hypothetical protein OIU84_004733 [Salix udensis]|uniref:Uncharacterized protein n=1 Tax=Salix udensis TaxID=889485 RepID=A0AAD6K4M0_9ROSI|nr:hypothetical protein OIU84_004733 [Salix udensis]
MITSPFHILFLIASDKFLHGLFTKPFFTQLEDGLKTIEGSCAIGDNNRMASGATILFNKCVASSSGYSSPRFISGDNGSRVS